MIATPTRSKGKSTQEAVGSSRTPRGKRSRTSNQNTSSNGTPSKTPRADATSPTANVPVDPLAEMFLKSRGNKVSVGEAANLVVPPPPEDVNDDKAGEAVGMDIVPEGNVIEEVVQPPVANVPAAEKVVADNHPGRYVQVKNYFNNMLLKRYTAPESLLPTEILLSKIKKEVSGHICTTWKEVKDKGSYTGLFFVDNKGSKDADILSKQIIPDCLRNSFHVPPVVYHINFSEDLYHNQVNKIVEAIGGAISNTDHQSSIGGQTIVFLERIDKLWESISWEARGRVKVAEALKNLLLHPIIVLATSGKDLEQINEHDGLKLLFLNSRIVEVKQPDEDVKIRVFMQIFIKHAAFKNALKSYRDENYNPITDYSLEILGKCIGKPFEVFMGNILGICQDKPLLYILTVYDYLYNILVKNQQKDVTLAVEEISYHFTEGGADLIARLEGLND